MEEELVVFLMLPTTQQFFIMNEDQYISSWIKQRKLKKKELKVKIKIKKKTDKIQKGILRDKYSNFRFFPPFTCEKTLPEADSKAQSQ